MTALSTSEMNILLATAGDYEGVLAISEGIYAGIDYLPFRYHAWLKDPQRRMFVAKLEEKVVAFDSFLVVDGGVAAVLQGLRVAPWMRGRGVAGIIQKFTLDTLRLDHPDVTKIRLTRAEDPPPTMLNKYSFLHSKAVIPVYLSAHELEEALKVLESRIPSTCQEFPPPVFLDYSEVHRLFSGPLQEGDLLPRRLLIQAWLPITTCKANLDLMQRWRVRWLCSYPCDAMHRISGSSEVPYVIASSDITNDGSASKDDNISVSGTGPSSAAVKGFLSLTSPMFPVPLGDGKHRLDIDLFGTDLSCAKIHILLLLKEAVKALPTGGSIVCILYAEESLRDGLTGFLDRLIPFTLCREQLVLEMDIKPVKTPPSTQCHN
uniref:N-acetyltransferase domain-containing protein n=1 Tax=Leptobrachium leishanense TaxID=445787 RepID=A0A8C5PAK0_9ANUR